MEEKDFNPKIMKLIEDYSYVIEGLLGHIWQVPLFEIDKEEKRVIELLEVQFFSLLIKCKEIENDKEDRNDSETNMI